jgi:hypothetical protein
MKYITEADQLLRSMFFESWMIEEHWKVFLVLLELKEGITLNTLSDNIRVGIENGYTLTEQTILIKLNLLEP